MLPLRQPGHTLLTYQDLVLKHYEGGHEQQVTLLSKGSYTSTEVQSTYSTPSTNWAEFI